MRGRLLILCVLLCATSCPVGAENKRFIDKNYPVEKGAGLSKYLLPFLLEPVFESFHQKCGFVDLVKSDASRISQDVLGGTINNKTLRNTPARLLPFLTPQAHFTQVFAVDDPSQVLTFLEKGANTPINPVFRRYVDKSTFVLKTDSQGSTWTDTETCSKQVGAHFATGASAGGFDVRAALKRSLNAKYGLNLAFGKYTSPFIAAITRTAALPERLAFGWHLWSHYSNDSAVRAASKRYMLTELTGVVQLETTSTKDQSLVDAALEWNASFAIASASGGFESSVAKETSFVAKTNAFFLVGDLVVKDKKLSFSPFLVLKQVWSPSEVNQVLVQDTVVESRGEDIVPFGSSFQETLLVHSVPKEQCEQHWEVKTGAATLKSARGNLVDDRCEVSVVIPLSSSTGRQLVSYSLIYPVVVAELSIEFPRSRSITISNDVTIASSVNRTPFAQRRAGASWHYWSIPVEVSSKVGGVVQALGLPGASSPTVSASCADGDAKFEVSASVRIDTTSKPAALVVEFERPASRQGATCVLGAITVDATVKYTNPSSSTVVVTGSVSQVRVFMGTEDEFKTRPL